MSPAINELPQVQQEILIIMRRERLTLHRLAISLKDAKVDCPDPMPHLHALVDMDFVQFEASPEGGFWSLTNKGKVAGELLWFDKKAGGTDKLFRAMGKG
jgi:hypothetical protein